MPKQIEKTAHLLALASLRKEEKEAQAVLDNADRILAQHEANLAEALDGHRKNHAASTADAQAILARAQAALADVARDARIDPDDALEIDIDAKIVTSRVEVEQRESEKAAAAKAKADAEAARVRQLEEDALKARGMKDAEIAAARAAVAKAEQDAATAQAANLAALDALAAERGALASAEAPLDVTARVR